MPLLLAATGGASFEFVDIVRESKGLLLAVLVLLMLASTWVWVLWVAKYLQLKRLGLAQKKFEEDTRLADGPDELLTIAEQKKVCAWSPCDHRIDEAETPAGSLF
jgi:biopolymer transport protein ExbB/TolQ